MSGSTNINLTIALNVNNDIYLDANNNLAMLTGLDALICDGQSTCEAQLNEMPLAYDQGMPTMVAVFQGSNLKQFVAAGRLRLSLVPGVLQVKSFFAVQNGPVLNYTAQVLTIYGDNLATITNGTP